MSAASAAAAPASAEPSSQRSERSHSQQQQDSARSGADEHDEQQQNGGDDAAYEQQSDGEDGASGNDGEEQAEDEEAERQEQEDGEDDDDQQQQFSATNASSAAAVGSHRSNLPIISADSAPVDTSSVYAAFGRDTAAGRALFKLYNKNKTAYTPQVRVAVRPGGPTDPKMEAEIARRMLAATLTKPKYKMPTVKKSSGEAPVGRVPRGGGKKTIDAIEFEKARDAHLYRAPVAAPGALQALSREEQKRKLQESMEGKAALAAKVNGGASKLPAPLPGRGRGPATTSAAARKDPNQLLSESILSEIEERHVFLDAMRSRGASDLAQEATIKGEIASRLRELKLLDGIMEEERAERAALAGAGGGSAAAAGSAIPTRVGSGNRRRP